MPNFLDNLNQLGATINAPLQADPNLNMAALLMGAGLMQPIQPGQTPAGAFGQSLASSAQFLNKQRGEQAKLAQEKELKEREVGAYEGRTAAGVASEQARSAQDERQFQASRQESAQQHRERIQKAQSQIDLLLSQRGLEESKLLFEVDKNVEESQAAQLELDPSRYAKRTPDGAPIKNSFDKELYDYDLVLAKNRTRAAAGKPITQYKPYSPDKVRQRAREAAQNPNLYLRIIQDDVLVFGPKFKAEVEDAIHKMPPIIVKPHGEFTQPARAGVGASSGVGPTDRSIPSRTGMGLKSERVRAELEEEIARLEAALAGKTRPEASRSAQTDRTKMGLSSWDRLDILKKKLDAINQ